MSEPVKVLCRDIHGNAHLVDQDKLIVRKSTYAIIMQSQKILLVSDHSDGRWDFPGGGVEHGETRLQALHREVREETSLEIIDEPEFVCSFIEYFYDLESQAGWKSHRSYYKVAGTGEPRASGNGQDVAAAKFFDVPIHHNVKTAPIVRLLTEQILGF